MIEADPCPPFVDALRILFILVCVRLYVLRLRLRGTRHVWGKLQMRVTHVIRVIRIVHGAY